MNTKFTRDYSYTKKGKLQYVSIISWSDVIILSLH